MNHPIRILLSVGLGLFLGFTVAFFVSPDPTSPTPLAVGAVLTVVFAAVAFRILPADG